MTDRPILFSAPMVRALLDGRKTQTRRVLAPSRAFFGSAPKSFWDHAAFDRAWVDGKPATGQYLHVPCHIEDDGEGDPPDGRCALCEQMGWPGTSHRLYPRVEAGDRLFVRETWKPHSTFAQLKPRDVPPSKVFYGADEAYAPSNTRWVPGIHMPRWASRLTLHVTEVRIQRLQEISEEGAVAEGIERVGDGHRIDRFRVVTNQATTTFLFARDAYRALWDSLNAKRRHGWNTNPWVLALTFTVERANIDSARAAA